jgi:hypothetical protein
MIKIGSLELKHFGSASCSTKEDLLDVFWLVSKLWIDKSTHSFAHNLHLLVFGICLIHLLHESLQK